MFMMYDDINDLSARFCLVHSATCTILNCFIFSCLVGVSVKLCPMVFKISKHLNANLWAQYRWVPLYPNMDNLNSWKFKVPWRSHFDLSLPTKSEICHNSKDFHLVNVTFLIRRYLCGCIINGGHPKPTPPTAFLRVCQSKDKR